MQVIIDIIDHIGEEMSEMCKFNGITLEEYVLKCVMDDYNILKYGDLNEKIRKKEEAQVNIETIKVEEQKPRKKEEKKQDGKSRGMMPQEEITPTHVETSKTQILAKQEDVANTTDKPLQNKLKRTRTLKAK